MFHGCLRGIVCLSEIPVAPAVPGELLVQSLILVCGLHVMGGREMCTGISFGHCDL